MRHLRPWDLHADWLQPCKVILDPVHGDVYTTVLEQAFIDSAPFQRLRRVRQLHGCHHVYPGATHSRLSHALGALRVAQDLMDRIVDQRFGSHPVDDLFAEFDPLSSARDDPTTGDEVGKEAQLRDDYLRLVAESTVLARLGALLHDIGHVPFSHTIEDDLELLEPHDRNEPRLAELWDEMVHEIGARFEQRGRRTLIEHLEPLRNEDSELRRNLAPLILHRSPHAETFAHKYRFVADVVGDTICADLLDYLRRDHLNTGLPLALGDRFMSAFYVTPSTRGVYAERMALLLHRDGRLRVDVSDEVLKHLRYRYELTERVYMHHAKLAGDAMLGRMLTHLDASLVKDPASLPGPDRRARLACIPALTRARARANERPTDQQRLEDLLLSYGDDALLELTAAVGPSGSPALQAAGRLARALLDRNLYALCANATGAFGIEGAERLYKDWGSAVKRRQLEEQASRWASVEDFDHVLLWLPPPKSTRLKLAGVLVDHGRGISKFSDFSDEGRDIYDAHKRLWRICLFVHRSVTPEQRRAVAAYLAGVLDVGWDTFEHELGPVPSRWQATLAAMEVLEVRKVTDQVRTLVDDHLQGALAARSTDGDPIPKTHADLVGRMRSHRRGLEAAAEHDEGATKDRNVDEV